MGCRVQGAGFRVYPSTQLSALRVRGSGVGVRVHERAWYPRTQKVHEVGWGFGFRVQGVRLGVWGLRFRIVGVWFKV